jgi:hypothetical protein
MILNKYIIMRRLKEVAKYAKKLLREIWGTTIPCQEIAGIKKLLTKKPLRK